MRWHIKDDDYFMTTIDPKRAQQQLAMFAVHLSTSQNIHCKTLKVGTITEYINAVARLTFQECKIDIRKDNNLDKENGKFLKPILDELKRWEDVPNRREPFTPEMLDETLRRAALAPEDSLKKVLGDWSICALYGGFRCSEYAQTPSNCRDPKDAVLDFRGNTKAFCLNDIRARTSKNYSLVGAEILNVPVEDISDIWIKFRTQKNGKHGIERLFRSKKEGKISFIKAMYRILARFVRLCGRHATQVPLSVYRASSGIVQLLTSNEITDAMRDVAATVLHLDPKRDRAQIMKWSTHAYRVGACVFLHANGFSAIDIKWILRWDSEAYLTYLRNFSGLSDRQAEAFEDAFSKLDDPTSGVAMPMDFFPVN